MTPLGMAWHSKTKHMAHIDSRTHCTPSPFPFRYGLIVVEPEGGLPHVDKVRRRADGKGMAPCVGMAMGAAAGRSQRGDHRSDAAAEPKPPLHLQEFYVLQSEFYGQDSEEASNGSP